MTTHAWRHKTIRGLLAASVVLAAVACSGPGGGGPSASTSAAPGASTAPAATTSIVASSATAPTPAATSAASADPTPALGPDTEAFDPGRHDGRHLMGGGATSPGYSVEVPAGWFGLSDTFVVKNPEVADHGPVLGLSVWDVGTVFRDPCHWDGQGFDPGPKVDDLVAALVAQPMRNATTPTDVTLAGRSGRYLELSVPADLRSSSWSSFDDCDRDADDYHDFQGWLGVEGGNRHAQVPGQVDRVWVLDVDGQRVVVDATYSPDTTQADRDELGRIAESIRFTER